MQRRDLHWGEIKGWLPPRMLDRLRGWLLQAWRWKLSNISADPAVRALYESQLNSLQRSMLLLFFGIQLPLATLIAVNMHRDIWSGLKSPNLVFAIQHGHLLLLLILVTWFVRRGRPQLAWASMIAVNLTTILAEVWLLQEPGAITFSLFTLAGAAIILPLRVMILVTSGLVACFIGIASLLPPATGPTTLLLVLMLLSVLSAFVAIGVVVRRFIMRSAYHSIVSEREAVRRAQAEQQIQDFGEQIVRISTLEHDLRQPLRAIQGNLTLLGLEAQHDASVIVMTAAAARRAERLINNLLELARAELAQSGTLRRPTDPRQFCQTLQQGAHGLSLYYTDPPVPILVENRLDQPLLIDPEQLERALLNLLDNALAYAGRSEQIMTRFWAEGADLWIEVEDQGQLPASTIAAMLSPDSGRQLQTARFGLGLQQVRRAVLAHNGELWFNPSPSGLQVRMRLSGCVQLEDEEPCKQSS